ncbi:MAG: PHB depolymerase family esterase [Thermoproteota archaeon]
MWIKNLPENKELLSKRITVKLIILIVLICLIIMILAFRNPRHSYPSPGRYDLSINVDGRVRNYAIHIPTSYDSITPLPLVIVLHGYGGNPRSMESATSLSLKADKEGFIVIYPEGISLDFSWNAGFCCGQAALNNIDDIAFIRRLIEKTMEDLKIDPKRIYAVGFSNGGMMSHRLGAELFEFFAAIAVVAGSIGKTHNGSLTLSPPSRAVSVIIIHGMRDEIIPYAGGRFPSEYFLSSVKESVHFWVQANNCSKTPLIEESPGGNVIKTTYSQGINNTEVILYTIKDGTHSWSFNGISTTNTIWEFFEGHPKP